jgi:prepilin-type N-terminal cleavage/methylation domain-containing protein
MEMQTMNARSFHRRGFIHSRVRGGFTLIELLVTIGIILVLIGIVFVALKHVGRSATENATKIDLQNLQSMLAELENAGPLTTTIQYPNADPYLIQPGNVQLNATNSTLPPVGDVTETTYLAGGTLTSDRWMSVAICETQFVIGRMRSLPSNRQSLQSLPGERLMKAQFGGIKYAMKGVPTIARPIIVNNYIDQSGKTTNTDTGYGIPDPPILVDAWKNPIIFVPGGGLAVAATYNSSKVYKKGSLVISGSTLYRALKDGTLAAPANADWETLPAGAFTSNGVAGIVTAPGNRPFFASAGPDGDFQAPDDNMYSFEQ